MSQGVATILVVTDAGMEGLRIMPELRGFRVRVGSGDDCSRVLAEGLRPDVVLVDFRLPDAADLCRRIRKDTASKLVGLLPRSCVEALATGVGLDDFVVMPPQPHELSLRIRRCLNGHVPSNGSQVLHVGELFIDPGRCEVTVGDKSVLLTFREYQLLRFLAGNPGRVFSRDELLDRVWGYDYYGGDRTVDVHVRRLRAKLELRGHTFIETVRNIGYRFKDSR